MSFYSVQLHSIQGSSKRAYAVVDPLGEIVVAYANSKYADDSAKGHTNFMIGEAEEYDFRRTAALSYLNARKARIAVPAAQLELF